MRRRNIILASVGSIGIISIAGCSSNTNEKRKVIPPNEPFTIGDIRYTISGTTGDSNYFGNREYYATEGNILINIDMRLENVGEDTVKIDTDGRIETPDGDLVDPEGRLYGTLELSSGNETGGSMLFGVADDHSKWHFIIDNKSVPIVKDA